MDRDAPQQALETPTAEPYLGPGEVVDRPGEPGVRVRLEDAPETPVRAVELAFTFPYAPAPGDRLLVFGRGDAHYAIGVLSGRGQPELAFPGDVDVRAVDGTLDLRGGEGVRVEAPRVTLRADTLHTFARSITEKAESTYRWVKDLLAVRAGDSDRTVLGEDASRSKRSVTLAEETVKIDGHQVHLGH